MDHDQRMKTGVPLFIESLMRLATPLWAPRLDYSSLDWLDKELYPDPPEGTRRVIDLLARAKLFEEVRGKGHLLLHVEVESGDSLTGLRLRMPGYRAFLHQKHGLPVLSVGLYLGVGLDGLGWDGVEDVLWSERFGATRWPYVGLPALDAMSYVAGDNLLAVAFTALMAAREDRRPWLKAAAMKRIAEADLTDVRRHALMEIVEAYTPFVGPHLREYEDLLVTRDYDMALKMGETTYEKGQDVGQRKMLLQQVEAAFGPMGEAARRRLMETWPMARVLRASLDFRKAASLADLGLDDGE